MKGRVLIVAGSDSGGGAGIQADIKAVTALGGFAATAVTALTAQNTQGVFGVVGVEPAFIRQQMELVLDDIGADAIKTGMLHSAAVIDVVSDVLETLEGRIPVVVDPVMVAQSGDSLLDPAALDTLSRRLIGQATLLTPNLHEAEKLTGQVLRDVAGMKQAAAALVLCLPAIWLFPAPYRAIPALLAAGIVVCELPWPRRWPLACIRNTSYSSICGPTEPCSGA